jgi:hypothetical protein
MTKFRGTEVYNSLTFPYYEDEQTGLMINNLEEEEIYKYINM